MSDVTQAPSTQSGSPDEAGPDQVTLADGTVTSVRRPRRRRAERAATEARWPLSRIIGVGVLVIALVAAASVVSGVIALNNLSDARDRVADRVDPAIQQALRLSAALLDQETGVRGYALSAQDDFLSPYTDGLATQNDAVKRLQGLVRTLPDVVTDLDRVSARADTWRSSYAAPTIAQTRANGHPDIDSNVDAGKAAFDGVRSATTTLQSDLNTARLSAERGLNRAVTVLDWVCIGIAAVLVIVVVVLAFGLRVAAIRPLSRLANEARQVAGGDFEHEVGRNGPREVRNLALDVDRMRERILYELSALRAANVTLDTRTKDLQRSNSELEQFAYVASHDLQEPLRKVASFCQLLQRRYSGQLDGRADQYIEFAVDGAKRMQVLINDLLAFSRVGRIVRERTPIPCASLLSQARTNLAEVIDRTGATIEAGELPTVLAEGPLLTMVFQNLLGNAMKFHGDQAPHIVIEARRDGDMWEFSFTDNGIGIKPEYAERIFVIFQRLHGKEVYPGTGIGLAMCRKIVEYHGGKIWLDTTVEIGSRFRFTLPVLPGTEPAPEDAPEATATPEAKGRPDTVGNGDTAPSEDTVSPATTVSSATTASPGAAVPAANSVPVAKTVSAAKPAGKGTPSENEDTDD
jgi:signal transduction histidine kinase